MAYGPESVQPSLPPDEVRRLCREYKKSLALSEDEIRLIEEDTRDQGNDTTGMWLHLRRSRITSSNFGVVCKRRPSTPVANLVKNLLYRSAAINSSSLRWDRENEDNARKAYAEEMLKRCTPVVIKKTGLVISSEKPHLACSPDDFVEDENVADCYGTAEYKCPYSAREMSPNEACSKVKTFYCNIQDGNVQLKRNHNYYHQIQGVLGITGRKWCDFVIWTLVGISIERIKFDLSFWENILPKLDAFWNKAILPELAAPEHPHKRPIREPGSW